MRKIISSVHVSLDGFLADGEGGVDWANQGADDAEGDVVELLRGAGAILFGRVTYQELAEYWPTASGELADLLNTTPKLVFSRNKGLQHAEWGTWGNARALNGAVDQQLRELKQQDGGDLVVFASADLAGSLSGLGLIDEYHIQVHPVILGAGKPFFGGASHTRALALAGTKTYPHGSVLLRYTLAGHGEPGQ